MSDEETLTPSLQTILDQKSLKWIFVGGKGGVGKTTTSCSLAVQMARARKSVLLISTDPAHNLSDAFGVKFGKDARPVPGVENLSAMEIDPNGSIQDLISAGGDDAQEAMQGLGGVGNMFQDMAFSIPGVDEAMSFAEVLKQVKGADFVETVRHVAAGQSMLDPAVTAQVLTRLREGPPEDPVTKHLTPKEHQSLDLVGEGMTNRLIAERLALAEKTVKNYVSSLLAKLGLTSRTQAAIFATKHPQG